jgi:hypothetical protein
MSDQSQNENTQQAVTTTMSGQGVIANEEAQLAELINERGVQFMSFTYSSHPGISNPILQERSEIAVKISSTELAKIIHPICCEGVHCSKKVNELDRLIYGIRFKCAICQDVDFREQCASSTNNSHNKEHL